ncbi:MAG: hypothetical protein KGY81_06765, partial [Phycisphaerae bacterium]|nr:hypothetical protein [Phycisphaerae bacterium]
RTTGASLLPALPLTLEKIATIEDSSVILLADDRLRPIERDGVLFAVADKTMQFWPVDKLVAHAHDYEPRSIDIGNMASAARTARSNMNYPWAAGLSEDGSLLWLASAAEAVGVDIDEAKVVHRVTMQSLGLNNAAEVAMGEGVMIAMDSRGMIATMSLADGSRGWPSRIAVDHAREAMQSRFTLDAGCAVLLTNRHCDLHVFDIKSGKVIFSEQANVVAGAQFTPDDKLVVTVDDEITLREPKPEAIQTPLAGRVLETEDAAILLDVGTHYAVVALSRDGSQLRAIRLADLADGSGVSIRSQPLPSGGEGHPFAAMVDGQSIYVLSSKRPSMPRTLQNATARLDGGFGIARFKMPIGEQKWSRFVETNVDASCRVLPRNTTGQILVGLRATNPEKPGGWVLLEKANRNKPVRIDVASRSRRNRKAVLRQRQIGAAAIVDGRLIIETPTGLAIYGEK